MSDVSTTTTTCLAIDIGASSGRVILATLADGRIAMQEVHRFPNVPVSNGETLRWDFVGLLEEVRIGLRRGAEAARVQGLVVRTIGIDTWGVDYGLIDASGLLMEPPVHYRDTRTNGMMERVFGEEVPAPEIFALTGIQFMQFNTLFQLVAERRSGSGKLSRAAQLLLMGDLFHHALTGSTSVEFSNATTTQLCDPLTRQWSWNLIDRLELPRHLFPLLVEPGTRLGALLPAVIQSTGLEQAELVAVGTHDTASAVAAVPATDPNCAYISCGTWSLIGTEVLSPLLTKQARLLNFTNEGGVFGTFRLLKNVMGLWLLQESQRQWEREGLRLSWDDLVVAAAAAPPLRSLINPDDVIFFPPGEMATRIRTRCVEIGEPAPADPGAITRCILESLALTFRRHLKSLEQLSGRRFPLLHIVGGGARNQLLCQLTADACGVPVKAGPVEATAMGNIGMQLAASGRISGLAELRAIVATSETLEVYKPRLSKAWEDAAARFDALYGSA